MYLGYLGVFGENQEVDALYKLKQKLKSQAGASITFALLLFLVCAVVGSVVLTAGTAAAGRMSELAKMDQRYYSVTSAAQLLRDTIDGESVVLEQINTHTKTGDAPETSDFGEVTWKSPDDETMISPLIRDAAAKLTGDESIPETGTNSSWQISSSLPKDTLKTNINETLDSDGTMTLVISNDTGETSGYIYSLKMVFTADLVEKSDIRTEEKYEKYDENNVKVTTKTETVTTSIVWKLNNMSKAEPEKSSAVTQDP